jgi:hypothetical protein
MCAAGPAGAHKDRQQLARSPGGFARSCGKTPGYYYPNSQCTWLITSPGTIRLNFISFNTELNYDSVSMYECMESACRQKKWIASLWGTVSSETVYTSSTGYLWIQFLSNEATQMSGFVA